LTEINKRVFCYIVGMNLNTVHRYHHCI